LIIQQDQGLTSSSDGAHIEGWVTLSTPRAEGGPLKANEQWQARQAQSEITHQFKVRYSKALADLTGSVRAIFRGRLLHVAGVRDADERRVELIFDCIEAPDASNVTSCALTSTATTTTYSTPGSYTFDSNSKTLAAVRAWGAGGGGGTVGGGGGGGHASGVPTNAPTSIAITIRGGGVHRTASPGATAATWDSGASYVRATAGACGQSQGVGTGGTGQTAGNVGTVVTKTGGDGDADDGGGGSSAGTGANGNSATSSTGAAAVTGGGAGGNATVDGSAPGGGGGYDADGGADKVEIDWMALVVVTSPYPHGLSTGATIRLKGTSLYDGDWTITVISSTTFSLDGSTYTTATGPGGRWTLLTP
jgi:SPP1 family predicted phage head-tail adaptor